jgi:GH24 family phage-related lysozyme (muramidase)
MDQDLDLQLRQLNATIAGLSGAIADIVKPIQVATDAINRKAGVDSSSANAKIQNTGAIDRIDAANKKAAEVGKIASDKISSAFTSLGGAARTFSQTVLSDQEGFTKYGSTINQVGKASLELGSAFGPLGTILGAVGFGLSKVAEQAFKQADGLLKGLDALSNVGSAGQITSKELYGMAHNMGLTSQNLDLFTKAVDRNRTSMIMLGDTAGDGAKQLARMATVLPEQRMAFQRLGVDQEALIGRISDYAALQQQSGLAISKRDLADGTAQKHALEYAETISVISTLTGKNAEEAKKGMEEAKANYDIQIHQRQLQMQLDDPKVSAAKKDEIRKRMMIEDQLINAAQQTGDKQYLAAVRSKLATGVYNSTSAVLIRQHVDLDAIVNKQLKRSADEIEAEKGAGEARAELLQQTRKGYEDNVQNLGDAMVYSDETARKFGGTLEMSTYMATNANTDFKKQNEDAKKAIGDPSKGKTNENVDEDPAQVARNKMTQMQILAGQKLDDLTLSMNPLLGNTGMFTAFAVAVGAVTASFAAIIAAKAISSGKELLSSGGLRGMLGGFFKKGGGGAAKGATGLGGRLLSGAGKLGKLGLGGAAVAGLGYGAYELYKNKEKLGFGSDTMEAPKKSSAHEAAENTKKGIEKNSQQIKNLREIHKQAHELKQLKVDSKKIEDASAAAGAFAAAMNAVSSIGEGVGHTVTGVFSAISEHFKTKLPYQELEDFTKKTINKKKVDNNAEALISYSKAMAAFKGYGSGLGSITASIADGIRSHFKATLPLQEFQDFANINSEPEQVKKNAISFVYFSDAMSSYKGGEGVLSAASTIAGAKLNALFGQDSAVDAFYKFNDPKNNIGPNALDNSKAFLDFSKAMGMLSGASGGALSGLANGAAAVAGGAIGAVASLGSAALGALGSAGSWVGSKLSGAFGSFGNWIMDSIAGHEGVRTKPYKDSLGLWTVGVGHLIGDGRSLPAQYNREFSKDEVKAMFQQDYQKHAQAASGIPGFNNLNEKGKGALIDMTFNMGPGWYRRWPNFTRALGSGDVQGAASQLEGSKWSKQVGRRAQEDIAMIRAGAQKAKKGGLFDGPTDGYPMELHGTELVIPIDNNSILSKLASTNAETIAHDLHHDSLKAIPKPTSTTGTPKKTTGITKEMIHSLAIKFDKVVNKIESTNHVQKKLLKHAL